MYVLCVYENFGQYAEGGSGHCKAIFLDNYVVVIEKVILFLMTSYKFRSSCLRSEIPRLCIVTSSRIFLVSVIGIFDYILVKSREANVEI